MGFRLGFRVQFVERLGFRQRPILAMHDAYPMRDRRFRHRRNCLITMSSAQHGVAWPLNDDRALMTVTHVTDFLHNGSHFVSAVAFNPEKDNEVVSASFDCTLKVWSLTDGQCKQTLRGHS